MDDRDEVSVVESLLQLNSTAFHQGEKVLAYYGGVIHEAKVLQVDCGGQIFNVHGLNQEWSEWVGVDRLWKSTIQFNTISNTASTATETEMDDRGEDSAVGSLLQLKSDTFHQGEKGLASYRGGIQEAKVLEVDSKRKLFRVLYPGLNQEDAWVGVERLMKHNKENLQNQKALEKHPLENSTKEGLHLRSPDVTGSKKRKTMSKVNEFATSVVGSPPTLVEVDLEALNVDHAATPGVGYQDPPCESMAMDKLKHTMKETSGSILLPLKHGPELLEPQVLNVGSEVGLGPSDRFIPGWGLTNDANLLDPDKALEFITHAVPLGTRIRLSAMSQRELRKVLCCKAVENLVYMAEVVKRLETFEAKEIELKEELRQCKATMTSQAKDIGIAAEVAVRLRKELKEVQAERADVIKEASRAEAARAQVEAETSALRSGRLELLGRVSEAEGAKMRAEDEAAVLKAENAELLKKLAESEAAKKHADERLVVAAET